MSSLKVHYDACPLGHTKIESTVRDVESPLDRLDVNLTKRTPPG